jgi:hypothetical protein
MEAISIETTPDKYLISVDRNFLNKDFVLSLVEKLRLEHLAEKVDFDNGIEETGKSIKAEWWAKNKQRLLDANK